MSPEKEELLVSIREYVKASLDYDREYHREDGSSCAEWIAREDAEKRLAAAIDNAIPDMPLPGAAS